MKNSKLLKTIVATIALTFAINIAAPQKANAGIFLYAIGKSNHEMTDEARHALQVFGIVFFIVGIWNGPGYIILDADTSINKSNVSQALQGKYDVLATQPAIANEIATAVALEGNNLFKANESADKVEVKLPATAVAAILRKAVKNADTQASWDKIAADLTN